MCSEANPSPSFWKQVEGKNSEQETWIIIPSAYNQVYHGQEPNLVINAPVEVPFEAGLSHEDSSAIAFPSIIVNNLGNASLERIEDLEIQDLGLEPHFQDHVGDSEDEPE